MRSLVVMPQIWRKNRLMASSIIWAFIISLELLEDVRFSEILTNGPCLSLQLLSLFENLVPRLPGQGPRPIA